LIKLKFKNRNSITKIKVKLKQSVQGNSDLSDIQWLQASLPVRDGGLGVRRVSSLALPAFLTSAASTLFLQGDIFAGCTCSEDSSLQSYLSDWSSAFGDVPDVLPTKQPVWDRPGISANLTQMRSSLNTPSQQASCLAASSPHSGDWLQALPISSFSLRLADEAVRI